MTSFFIFLSILLSVVALTLALAADLSHSNSLPTVLNLLGISITSTAFIIGCFFALKAIDAYRHLKEIEKQVKEIKEMKALLSIEVKEVLETKTEVFSSIASTAELTFQGMNEILMSAGIEGLDKKSKGMLENALKLVARFRSELFYIKHLPDENKGVYLQLLTNFGDETDLERLEKIIHDSAEEKDFRDLAKKAYKMIQQRLMQESNDSSA